MVSGNRTGETSLPGNKYPCMVSGNLSQVLLFRRSLYVSQEMGNYSVKPAEKSITLLFCADSLVCTGFRQPDAGHIFKAFKKLKNGRRCQCFNYRTCIFRIDVFKCTCEQIRKDLSSVPAGAEFFFSSAGDDGQFRKTIRDGYRACVNGNCMCLQPFRNRNSPKAGSL